MSSSDLKAAVEALYRGVDEARRNEANQKVTARAREDTQIGQRRAAGRPCACSPRPAAVAGCC